ncbi:MAG TPA: cytochrome c-type biogenesis protein, partial [Pyrinomonadaceae bacterium]|nr:cytochrome c-type biogenesis protein [Pyrinomonadaceae bacterium]
MRTFLRRAGFVFVMVCSLLLSASGFALAKEAQPNEDPKIEQRMKTLTEQLRCLVCQNETLADSRADLAEDLRKQIREQIKAGKSDQEIIAFLTDRYGDFVLYKP